MNWRNRTANPVPVDFECPACEVLPDEACIEGGEINGVGAYEVSPHAERVAVAQSFERVSLADAETRVAALVADHSNNEESHQAEDFLWLDVLRAIADGAPNAADLARAALKTTGIDFTRWYA